MLPKILNFLQTDIWRIRLKDQPKNKSFFIKQLRVILLARRGFDENKCQLRASALTFYTLLSIVPVIAMAFGISKGFGLDKMLEKQLLERIPGQEEVLLQVISFAKTMLENTKGGVIAGIGVALLFWTVIKVLGNIEESFNDIWGIQEKRSLSRRFSDYLSVMLLSPILLVASSGITIFIATQITTITQKFEILGVFAPVIFLIVKFLPYCAIWILFTFIYIFMPNTKVRFKSGIIAGIIAGTVYQIVQWMYIKFQVGVANYNAIYGSFAALPLFLAWLQLSWLIVLFGVEISFAHQNVDTYEFEPDCLGVSHSFKKLLALLVNHLTVKHFIQGEKPLTANEISHQLEIPIRLVHQILFESVKAGLLSEVTTQAYKEPAYQPARDVDTVTVKYVIDALEKRGIDKIPVVRSADFNSLFESLKTLDETIAKSGANKLLKNI
jgi:membrane protein